MFNLTIICIILAAITACFWCSEWAWGKKGMEFIKGSKYLIMDIVLTIAIVKVFSLGGLIGTCMGFVISNVISLFLMFARLNQNKEQGEEC